MTSTDRPQTAVFRLAGGLSPISRPPISFSGSPRTRLHPYLWPELSRRVFCVLRAGPSHRRMCSATQPTHTRHTHRRTAGSKRKKEKRGFRSHLKAKSQSNKVRGPPAISPPATTPHPQQRRCCSCPGAAFKPTFSLHRPRLCTTVGKRQYYCSSQDRTRKSERCRRRRLPRRRRLCSGGPGII